MSEQTRATPAPRSYAAATAAFRSGADTPRAFLERCLQDLERWEDQVGAFTALDREGARLAADAASLRWREGAPRSPIDGMPVGLKDVIDTDDMPTQMGSSLFEGHRPRFGAASAHALREAGAVILGKTVTTEFASTEPRGTRNPWDLARTPGGSSSGSAAAVAYGAVAGAMGTQVVGSILRPAGFCGVVGYKPSLGGINRGGSLDLLSQSCHGPLAASLADAWLMAIEVARRVGGDPGYPGLTGPDAPPPPRRPERVALLQTPGWSGLAPDARAGLEQALERLRGAGVRVLTRRELPALDALEGLLGDALELAQRINAWEWRWPLGAFLARDAAGVSRSAQDRAALGAAMTPAEYAGLLDRRAALRRTYAELAGGCDLVVGVTAPGAAPVGLGSTGNPVFVVPGSLLGVPALSLPLLHSEGLPLGLQLLGFEGEDATLFGHAAWVEGLHRG